MPRTPGKVRRTQAPGDVSFDDAPEEAHVDASEHSAPFSSTPAGPDPAGDATSAADALWPEWASDLGRWHPSRGGAPWEYPPPEVGGSALSPARPGDTGTGDHTHDHARDAGAL